MNNPKLLRLPKYFNMRNQLTFLLGLLLLWTTGCSNGGRQSESAPVAEAVGDELPLHQLDLSALSSPVTGWTEVGGLRFDPQGNAVLEPESGTGILLSQGTADGSPAVFDPGISHQDLKIALDFLLPPAGAIELIFQGKYPLTLNDSWRQEEVFCGSVAGQTPAVNAAKAPGLWQHFSASFQAPDFNDAGEKIANACLKEVRLNGMLLFAKIELPSEQASLVGPLLMSGSPNTAIRNLQYKQYGDQSLRLEDISYQLYHGDWDVLPDFQTLTPVDSGQADFIDLSLAGKNDKYAMKFSGNLYVPTAGDYFLQSIIDDGGDILIDRQLVLHNDGEPNIGTEQTITRLDSGWHDFTLTYFQDHWGAVARIMYEGPEIAMQRLASGPEVSDRQEWTPPTLPIEQLEAPELLRCFADYQDTKRTHVIAVGIPGGPHYLYDLEQMALLKTWRGAFADVAGMWINRGEHQLMQPLNAAIELNDGLPVAQMSFQNSNWPTSDPEGLKRYGYDLDQAGLPTFKYQIGAHKIEDRLAPDEAGYSLTRQLVQDGPAPLIVQLARGAEVIQLGSGLYRIDGQYYLQMLTSDSVFIHEGRSLRAILDQAPLRYRIIW